MHALEDEKLLGAIDVVRPAREAESDEVLVLLRERSGLRAAARAGGGAGAAGGAGHHLQEAARPSARLSVHSGTGGRRQTVSQGRPLSGARRTFLKMVARACHLCLAVDWESKRREACQRGGGRLFGEFVPDDGGRQESEPNRTIFISSLVAFIYVWFDAVSAEDARKRYNLCSRGWAE